jgi:hypothetical protein
MNETDSEAELRRSIKITLKHDEKPSVMAIMINASRATIGQDLSRQGGALRTRLRKREVDNIANGMIRFWAVSPLGNHYQISPMTDGNAPAQAKPSLLESFGKILPCN